uniref:Mesoderm induction early response protein 1 n=1 Tax=Acrobeloides nanus TaxID=290746 RepID=A0A914BWC1_9BILA
MDDESSKNSYSDDYEEDEDENYEDDEGTLEEEESLPKDDVNELNELQAESEMSIEELRRKYYGELAAESTSVQVTSTTRTSSSRRNRGITAIETTKEVVVEYADSTEPGSSSKSSHQLTYFTEDMLRDDEPDEEYKPPEYWKKVIRVGKMYQAQIPAMLSDEKIGVSGEDDRAVPVWKPLPQLTDDKIDRYLLDCYTEAKEEAIKENQGEEPGPPKIIPDDEDALYALFRENYNLRKAQRQMPFSPANATKLTYKGPWTSFSEDECALFEEGLRTTGKKFHLIQANYLPMRNVGELVQFYYTWKKTERYDMFVKRLMAQKEDPNCTDYMDSIVDQIESSTQVVTTSFTSSGSLHSTLLLNSIVSSTTSEAVKIQNQNGSSSHTATNNAMVGQLDPVNKN